MDEHALQSDGRQGRRGVKPAVVARQVNYHDLKNPFPPQTVFSEDRVGYLHHRALEVLERFGVKVLLPEARQIFRTAGAIVDESTEMVRIGRDLVENALATAPKFIHGHAGQPHRDLRIELGQLSFMAGCGAPNVTDLDQGRRAGTLADYENLVKLVQGFDVLQWQGPYIEAQDVEPHLRHYAVTRAQLALSDKFPFVYARGTPQVEDGFEMIRIARGLSAETFMSGAYCYTVINTNSPRQLDIPMAQGIIDFARYGQPTIITPFCLAGAMAPITVAGALTLQHAEALCGITLAQLSRSGAPVIYGSFSSNVNMKSGSPAFGTPEHIKATLGAGQLARHLGLPWRSGGGSASNVADAQAAHETQFGLWGATLAGATVCVHAAGWMEGGLSVSYEKLITDLESIQTIAELCIETPQDDDAFALDAIAEVQPGGHFFSTAHTMSRYRTAFYEPLVADLSNFGNWIDAGALSATQRANALWKKRLAAFEAPAGNENALAALHNFIDKRTRQGGATPVS